MDPQQSPGHNPYDFIMKPPAAPRKSVSEMIPGLHSNSLAGKIFVLVGAFLFLIIIITVVVSVFGGGNADVANLESIAESQQEIVRVATAAENNVTQTSTQNLAIDVVLSVQTQQNQVLSFLSQHGTTVKPSVLMLKQNPSTTNELLAAQQNSTVDQVFAQIMQSELTNYSNLLKQSFGNLSNTTAKSIIATEYSQTQLLIKQVPTQSSLNN